MSLSHRYQDLSSLGIDPAALMAIPQDGLEDLKLDSFENGYRAGWDDSTKAHDSEQERAIVAIAQRLEDLSFTQTEAIAKMTAAMQPLLTKITLRLLPDVARDALSAHVAIQMDELLRSEAQDSIEVAVAPETLEPLQRQLEGRVSTTLAFSAEPMLSKGQVYLRAKRAEREVNLDAVQSGITTALDAFFAETNKEELRHG